MTSTPNQPDPTPRDGSLDYIPDPLRGDLKRAYRSEDGITPPSRVDDAVFAAASAHFAKPAAQTEVRPGVLGWIGRRPLRSAGFGGALLAASVLVVVLIIAPNQPSPGDRSLAMDAMMEPEESADRIASRDEFSPSAPAPSEAASSGRAAGDIEPSIMSELGAPLADMAPRAQRESLAVAAALRGDVNADGEITIADALLLARAIERGETPSVAGLDLVADGRLDRADADAIARLAVRLSPANTDKPNTEGAS